jgi:hypothetical protein
MAPKKQGYPLYLMGFVLFPGLLHCQPLHLEDTVPAFVPCMTNARCVDLSEGSDAEINSMTGIESASGALLEILVQEDKTTRARPFCSGTLVGASEVLTAAHCVTENGNITKPKDIRFYLQRSGVYEVREIVVRNSYVENRLVDDVAIVKLNSPVHDIAPVRVNAGDAPDPGSPGTVIGFGSVRGEWAFNRNTRSWRSIFPDVGIRRTGEVRISICPHSRVPLEERSGLICTENDAPDEETSLPCNGDSGGGLFIKKDNDPTVAGIVSYGSQVLCAEDHRIMYTNLVKHREWIQSKLTKTDFCARNDCVNRGNIILSSSEFLFFGAERRFKFMVPNNTEALLVTISGQYIDNESLSKKFKPDFGAYRREYDYAKQKWRWEDQAGEDSGTEDSGTKEWDQIRVWKWKKPKAGDWMIWAAQSRQSGLVQVNVVTSAK